MDLVAGTASPRVPCTCRRGRQPTAGRPARWSRPGLGSGCCAGASGGRPGRTGGPGSARRSRRSRRSPCCCSPPAVGEWCSASRSAPLAVVSRRWRPDSVEVELTRQITRERRCARELAQLHGLGWTVLSDRLLPGTEHRLGHVLVGPGGVVVVSVLPATGLVREDAGVLWTGGEPLMDWFAARHWEVERLHDALARWPWLGPVFPVAVVPDDRVSGVRRGAGATWWPTSTPASSHWFIWSRVIPHSPVRCAASNQYRTRSSVKETVVEHVGTEHGDILSEIVLQGARGRTRATPLSRAGEEPAAGELTDVAEESGEQHRGAGSHQP